MGIAILPENEIADELGAGRLVLVLEGTLRDADLGVHVVHAHVRQVPPRLRAFVDFLVAWFRSPRWRT
jgi:DNA-binding transcriptional LysR family regulator